MTHTTLKALLLGGVLGIVSTLTGLSAAKADCSLDAIPHYQDYPSEADDCVYVAETTVDCDVTYSTAESCDQAMGQVYDACMVMLVSVRDTSDGAFWRTVEVSQ